jgi:glycosyltransferase involved in cell wall biosynthesis
MARNISIVIPVYRAEKFIKNCIDSVLSQTHSFYELILVDDGSPDCSGKICDDYAVIDQRIKVIHIKNGGVSVARNEGLRYVSGEYVVFIDSDDYIENDLIENIEKLLINNHNPELIFFGLIYEDYSQKSSMGSPSILPGIFYTNISSEVTEIFYKMFSIGLAHLNPGKAYRIDLLREHGIRFIERQQYGEDTCFMLDYYVHIKSVASIDKVQYHKIKYPNESLSSAYSADQYKYLLRIRKRFVHLINVRGKSFESTEILNRSVLLHFCVCVRNLMHAKCGFGEFKKLYIIQKMQKNLNINIIFNTVNIKNNLGVYEYYAINTGHPLVIYIVFKALKVKNDIVSWKILK